eukprot:TRINITY_DN62994_c0_g1_i1.p1 TRINITY_DN62994_c0_g1~~TRINITY_DN62994_c0_g1_i1.p1  ORF type:complete len:223 (-),score=46.79 TRINITY_DN62994_c0_g1_i1:137-805(-)
MIRRPPRSTLSSSSAASDVYKRQVMQFVFLFGLCRCLVHRYFAANDRSHSADKLNPGSFRDTVMGYIHFRADGTMAPIQINATGVGRYSAAERIQAENYFGASDDCVKQELNPGWGVRVIAGSHLHFPRIYDLPGEGNTRLKLTLQCSTPVLQPVRIAVSSGGQPVSGLCRLHLGDTSAVCELVMSEQLGNEMGLVLTFHAIEDRSDNGPGALLELDWISID